MWAESIWGLGENLMNLNYKEASEEHTEPALVRLVLTPSQRGVDWTVETSRGSLSFLKYAAKSHHGNE